jgi:NAD(P)-dependent dehydrogenase (short-subunit alcohol dehydrogenase family)
VVSVTELLGQFKAETEPDPPQQPKWETVNGTGDSVLDKFSNVATWSDILMPLGWTEAKVQDSDTLEAWKRPGGTDPISAKVPKVAPGTIVVWSTDAGLPCGPDQKLKSEVYARLHYGSDLSAASKVLVHGFRRSLSKPAKRRGIRSKALTTGNMATPYRAAGRRQRGP